MLTNDIFQLKNYHDNKKIDGFIPTLEMLIEDLTYSIPCPKCDGTGSYPIATSPDDYDVEVCERCWGTGFVEEKKDE
jgi:DnaJ-class molecular chaperone